MEAVWLNGRVLDAGSAMVSALDRGVLWGQGLFETLRAYDGRVWAFDDHHARMRSGAEVLDVPIPDAHTLRGALSDVIGANGLDDCGVRITITRGPGPAGPHEDAHGPPNVLVTAWALPDYTSIYERGVDLVTMPGGGRPLAGVKTTSYGASVAGRIAARRANADDALFVGADGEVLEATGSNLIVVRGRALLTPPLGEAVLPGVTCKRLLAMAPSLGYAVEQTRLTLDDLRSSDEVVLTSSLREVYPVRSVDGDPVPRVDAAAALRDAFEREVRRELGDP